MKKSLSRLGVKAEDIKRASIAMYEAEINAVIHGHGGMAEVTVHPDKVVIVIEDHGPGIPDLDQAPVTDFDLYSFRERFVPDRGKEDELRPQLPQKVKVRPVQEAERLVLRHGDPCARRKSDDLRYPLYRLRAVHPYLPLSCEDRRDRYAGGASCRRQR